MCRRKSSIEQHVTFQILLLLGCVNIVRSTCDILNVYSCSSTLIAYTSPAVQQAIENLNFDLQNYTKFCSDTETARKCFSSNGCTSKDLPSSWNSVDPIAAFMCQDAKSYAESCYTTTQVQSGFGFCQSTAASPASSTDICRANVMKWGCMREVAGDECGTDAGVFFQRVIQTMAQPLVTNCNLTSSVGPCGSDAGICFSSVDLDRLFSNPYLPINSSVSWPSNDQQLNQTCRAVDWSDACTRSYNCPVDSSFSGYNNGLQYLCNALNKQVFSNSVKCLSMSTNSIRVQSCFDRYFSSSNGSQCRSCQDSNLDVCIHDATIACGCPITSTLINVYRRFRNSTDLQDDCDLSTPSTPSTPSTSSTPSPPSTRNTPPSTEVSHATILVPIGRTTIAHFFVIICFLTDVISWPRL